MTKAGRKVSAAIAAWDSVQQELEKCKFWPCFSNRQAIRVKFFSCVGWKNAEIVDI